MVFHNAEWNRNAPPLFTNKSKLKSPYILAACHQLLDSIRHSNQLKSILVKSLHCLFLVLNIRSRCQIVFLRFSTKNTTLTKAIDSGLGTFTKNRNQSNCLFFPVFTGTRPLGWLHSSQPLAMICATVLCLIISLHQTKCQFLQFLQAASFSSLFLEFFTVSFFSKAVFWCVTVGIYTTWLKRKFMHSLITSCSHGSPTLSTLGKKDRCWICSVPSSPCPNLF